MRERKYETQEYGCSVTDSMDWIVRVITAHLEWCCVLHGKQPPDVGSLRRNVKYGIDVEGLLNCRRQAMRFWKSKEYDDDCRAANCDCVRDWHGVVTA